MLNSPVCPCYRYCLIATYCYNKVIFGSGGVTIIIQAIKMYNATTQLIYETNFKAEKTFNKSIRATIK